MKAMANYVMRGRLAASMMASLFAVLSLILPPFSYLSGGVIALIALRKGAVESAVLLTISSAALGAMSYATMGNMVVAIVFALVVWLPVWLLALVLRSTISLSLTMVVAAAFSIIAVIGFHIAVGNPVEWWTTILSSIFEQAMSQQSFDMMGKDGILEQNIAQMMTAIMATAFFVSMVLSLLLGRWWQAMLFNPGGFQQEFHQFRIDKIFAAISAVILVWATVSATMGSLAVDVAVVICAYAAVAGVALIHDWVRVTGANKAWLILLYLLLAFVAPQLLALLAIIGFMDAWLDIRRFYQNKAV